MSADTFTLAHGSETLRAVLVAAPPVYDPGGPVCLFVDWVGDEALLTEAEQEAAGRGAVLTRVVCAHEDRARADTLTRHGYDVASEWHRAPLPLSAADRLSGIRPVTVADIPRLLELGELKRRQYERYSPTFWRMSARPRETFAPYLQSQIESTEFVALAHEQGRTLDGYVLANGDGYVDDFMVVQPERWPTVGTSLLLAAGGEAQGRGVKSMLVVCGHQDQPKQAMLAAQGFGLETDWYVKPLQ